MEFNFADVHETIANAAPDREAFVFRDRRFTHRQLAGRTRRLANYLLSRGVKTPTERRDLLGHESGQDHVALYLYNGNEYLEGMLGAWKARCASVNVNYRYVEEELVYLFENSRSRVVIYHAEFASQIAAIRGKLANLEILIQVADGSGNALLPGAVDYEEALAGSSPDKPDVQPSGDDLYIVYTGGTTGMPKGVLWRSADIFVAAMGGRKPDGTDLASLEELAEQVEAMDTLRGLVGPPFMHGAAQWSSFILMSMGACLVVPDVVKKLDADDFLSMIAKEKITSITMVGDAFARPLLDQMEKKDYDLSTLFILGSGGAPLSSANKEALLAKVPHGMIFDGIGSSETGAQATNTSTKDTGASTGKFQPGPGACVLSGDLTHVLEPGSDEMGWFAQTGRVPLGYLGDPEKTARTFPVVGGKRYSVPGDRARYKEDGTIEVLGRDSVTINSGGEKIFAEEVEQALKQHSDVYDTVVTGRPSERWGQEVVAVVQLRDDATAGANELLAEAGKHVARYKLPKAFVFRSSIVRSPSGKADYRWAKEQAAQG